MLPWVLDTAPDDGEERLCLRFVEVRTQSKLRDLKIQARTKWIPRRFKYRRVRRIGSRWSIDVGNVLIRSMTIWVEFNLDIVKGGMIWAKRIGFQVKWFWWPIWECSDQRDCSFFYHTILKLPSKPSFIGEFKAEDVDQALVTESNVAKERIERVSWALFQ